MFVRPTNPVSHRLARLAFLTACVAALIVASAGPLHRYRRARGRRRTSRSSATASTSPSPAVAPGPRHHRADAARRSPARLRGGAARRRDRRAPPPRRRSTGSCAPSGRREINDITTDTANPPPLVVTLQLRRGAPNPPAYPGASAGVLQRAAYPDIVPVILPVPPAEAFKRVDRRGDGDGLGRRRARAGRRAASRRSPPANGSASTTTSWCASAPKARGSRVDIRSKSRVGESDLGVNARRIREFIARLKAEK